MLKIVPNHKKYWNFIRLLRINSKIQTNFVNSNSNISLEDQKLYMKKHNDDYSICFKDNVPVGCIRIKNKDIGLCVDPNYWGLGIGTFMIKEFVKLHPHGFAQIKLSNKASIRAFEKAGFKKVYYIMERNVKS